MMASIKVGMTSVYEEIKSMFSAGFPLIYLATKEYSRVMQKVRSICFSMGYKFHTWDAVDGLRTHVCNAGYKLQAVKQHEEHRHPHIFLLEESDESASEIN